MMKCFTVYSHSDTTIPSHPNPFHHLTIYSIHGFPATRAERLLFRGAKPRNKCLKAFSYYMEMLSHTHTPFVFDFRLFSLSNFTSSHRIKWNENAHKLYKVPGESFDVLVRF